MSLFDRISALITAQWDTDVLTPKPTIFDIDVANSVDATYMIGIEESPAPMGPVGLGSAPTHERRWGFRLELGCRSSEADLEKMIEECWRILDAATLTSGFYTLDEIGKKSKRHGVRYQNMYGEEYQLITPPVF